MLLSFGKCHLELGLFAEAAGLHLAGRGMGDIATGFHAMSLTDKSVSLGQSKIRKIICNVAIRIEWYRRLATDIHDNHPVMSIYRIRQVYGHVVPFCEIGVVNPEIIGVRCPIFLTIYAFVVKSPQVVQEPGPEPLV